MARTITVRLKGIPMNALLHDPPAPTLLAAIDRNWRASMRAFGLAPHVQLRDDDQVFWFITGVPDSAFNSIMYAHLTLDQIAAVTRNRLCTKSHNRQGQIPDCLFITTRMDKQGTTGITPIAQPPPITNTHQFAAST